jgi:predicted Holliday junction resolvase-like endonuclease
MEYGLFLIVVGVALMFPFISYVWDAIVDWMWPTSPAPKRPDYDSIIDGLRESMATIHTDLENWIGLHDEKVLIVKDLEAKQIADAMTIESLEGEVLHQKGRAASAHTTRGQLLEKWTPFVSAEGIEDHWRVEDWQFLGSPIDYVVFDWRQDKVENLTSGQVVLLDVKSGKSQLSSKQRRIRDLVKAGRVEWREIRLD